MAKSSQKPDYQKNVANYIDEFRSYETFMEAVRHLPGMYIGATGTIGWKACIREIFQNAIDEMIKSASPCNYVHLIFDERTQSATIIDNGRGIPHGHIIQIYTSAHMSTNFEETKKLYEYSSGTHGVGGGVAMALSEDFIIESYVLGQGVKVQFHKGQPWKKGEVPLKSKADAQGTSITLSPDLSIIGETNLTVEEVFNTLVMKIFFLIPKGYTIEFTGTTYDGKTTHQVLVNNEGIQGALKSKMQKPLIAPIVFGNDTGTMMCNVAFSYDPTDLNDREDIDGYGNYTPCEGAHVNGFLQGLTSFFMGYMNKIYLKSTKLTVISADIKAGLKAVVEACHLHPTFEGQGKVALNNPDLVRFVSDLTKKSLDNWAKVNPTDLNKLCKYFKDIAEIRTKLDTSKTKLSNQYVKSVISGDPKKYLSASSKKGLELFIVEGDSAYGSARSARDSKIQAIFPIRGKMPNAFAKSKSEFFQNSEVCSINRIITRQDKYDPAYDARKSPFDKIIVMADADPDGAHIRTLVLRMFLRYYPSFIMEGKLYAAVPPLFGLQQGGKTVRYFTDNNEVAKFTQQQFARKYVIEDKTTKKKLSTQEVVRLFAMNNEYTKLLETTASICGVSVKLLEDILIQIADDIEFTVRNAYVAAASRFAINMIDPVSLTGMIDSEIEFTLKKLNINLMKKRIESKYRFMHVDIQNRNLVIHGLAFDRSQTVVINPKFIRDCYQVISLLAKNERMYFKVNGTLMSLYDVMHLVDNLIPNLKRYKGLGEQNPSELRDSTMSTQNRTLIQYTMESAKEEIENIRVIDTDRAAILRGIQISRQDIE